MQQQLATDERILMNVSENQKNIIAEAYIQHRERVSYYIMKRINDWAEAENLTQDVFLRLLEYGASVNAKTVERLVFTIARNIMFDYLRHKYCANDAENYIISTYGNAVQECESGVIARDLESAEKRRVDRMPTQRRMVYMLKRYDDKKVAEIARGQNLSVRTVENHLRMARADIRQYMTKLMCV